MPSSIDGAWLGLSGALSCLVMAVLQLKLIGYSGKTSR